MAARRVDLSVDMLDPGDDTPAALERRSAESGVRGAERRREAPERRSADTRFGAPERRRSRRIVAGIQSYRPKDQPGAEPDTADI